jgi:membrane protein implicated in regulation of membrane protease activity
VPRAWWIIGLGLAGLLIVAAVALQLWGHPPGWLSYLRVLVVAALHWARVHWLTSGAVGVLVALLIYVLQRRAERHRIRAEQQERAVAAQSAEEQREAAAKAALAALLAKHCWVDEATGWLPRVRQVSDPVALGVHPAVDLVSVTTGASITERSRTAPLYVPRDLDSALDRAVTRGGFVLLVGDSTAGKSRAAFEAMHRRLGDWWLLVPNRRDSLRTLLDAGIQFRDTVVWLNDL